MPCHARQRYSANFDPGMGVESTRGLRADPHVRRDAPSPEDSRERERLRQAAGARHRAARPLHRLNEFRVVSAFRDFFLRGP